MKNVCYLLLMGLLMESMTFTAQEPVLIGHRGSVYGVENTREAFINGSKLGFKGLECDVKVTLDSQFVVCHDDDLRRLGYPDVVIAEHTLSDLQGLLLKQTRQGLDFEGSLCSLHDYLLLCKELHCFPLIELKWATGVNEHDQSLVPRLVEEVNRVALEEKPIYLSSMKHCLAVIREIDSNAQIQLLAYDLNVRLQLDWCKEQHISVDVAKGKLLTKGLVKKVHRAGLEVNVWTVNSVEEYEGYKKKGVDYITTDYLDLKR